MSRRRSASRRGTASTGPEPDRTDAVTNATTDADPPDAAPDVPGRGLLTFRLGDARFGLWIDEVMEVVRTPPITRLPLPVAELAGVCAVRGDVLPVLDLGVRLLGTAAARPGRLLLVHHEGSDAMVALLVDALDTLLTVREDELREPPDAAGPRLAEELAPGVLVRDDVVVTVLDLERVAAPPSNDTEEKRKP